MQIKRELADNILPSVCTEALINPSGPRRNIPGLSGEGGRRLPRYFHGQVPLQRGSRAFKVAAIKYGFFSWSTQIIIAPHFQRGKPEAAAGEIFPSPATHRATWRTTRTSMGSRLYALAKRPPATSRFGGTAPCHGHGQEGSGSFRNAEQGETRWAVLERKATWKKTQIKQRDVATKPGQMWQSRARQPQEGKDNIFIMERNNQYIYYGEEEPMYLLRKGRVLEWKRGEASCVFPVSSRGKYAFPADIYLNTSTQFAFGNNGLVSV